MKVKIEITLTDDDHIEEGKGIQVENRGIHTRRLPEPGSVGTGCAQDRLKVNAGAV